MKRTLQLSRPMPAPMGIGLGHHYMHAIGQSSYLSYQAGAYRVTLRAHPQASHFILAQVFDDASGHHYNAAQRYYYNR